MLALEPERFLRSVEATRASLDKPPMKLLDPRPSRVATDGWRALFY
jgi:hypothetical protein